jgi:hypothetical protein
VTAVKRDTSAEIAHMAKSWFSASLRFSIAVTPRELEYEDSVVVVRALNWDDAFNRAVEIGRQMEETDRISYGEVVDKRFLAIRTLEQLGTELTDGTEVFRALAPVATGKDGPEGTGVREPRRPAPKSPEASEALKRDSNTHGG